MKHHISALELTQVGIVAAIYAAVTVLLAPLSYLLVQVRISESLMLLCCYRKKWCQALTLGCLIANLFSGMALDMVFGTLATLLAALAMNAVKKPLPASLIPAVVNGIVIGAELYFFMDCPLIPAMLSVAAGELISVVFIGLPLLHAALRSETLRKLIDAPKP